MSRYDNRRVLLASHMRAFLNSAVITKSSAADLKSLCSSALQARRAFEALGRPVAQWDDWFVHVLVENLDSSSRLFWEASLQTSSEFPTLKQLQDFLQTRIRSLEAAASKPASAAPTSTARSQDRKPKVNALTTSTSGTSKGSKKCSFCQGDHPVNYCRRFKELPVPQRRDHVKQQEACFNCLGKHPIASCPSEFRCSRCQGKHHTLLHLSEGSASSETEASSKTAATAAATPSGPAVTANLVALSMIARAPVLLSTAQVACCNPQGDVLLVRTLLDSGSEAAFVTERVVRSLRLRRRRVCIPVSGIRGMDSGVVRHAVDLAIGSHQDHRADSVNFGLGFAKVDQRAAPDDYSG